MNSVAQNAGAAKRRSLELIQPRATPEASKVAAITAMPAPWGVGTRCDDRALGLARAYLVRNGYVSLIKPMVTSPPTIAAINASVISRLVMSDRPSRSLDFSKVR